MQEEILNEIKTLKIEIRNLSDKIDFLTKKTDEIKNSSVKMTNHIDFVENIYDRIKKPFYFLINKIDTKQLGA